MAIINVIVCQYISIKEIVGLVVSTTPTCGALVPSGTTDKIGKCGALDIWIKICLVRCHSNDQAIQVFICNIIIISWDCMVLTRILVLFKHDHRAPNPSKAKLESRPHYKVKPSKIFRIQKVSLYFLNFFLKKSFITSQKLK